MDWKTSDAQRRTSAAESSVPLLRSYGSPRFTPIEKRNRRQPTARAERSVRRTSRRTFFDFGSRRSPGRSTRDTTNGRHVADATDAVIKTTWSSVPRKSWRARYRTQKRNNVTGTIQYASTVESAVSNVVIGDFVSPCHRKCRRTSPIRYHGPSLSKV